MANVAPGTTDARNRQIHRGPLPGTLRSPARGGGVQFSTDARNRQPTGSRAATPRAPAGGFVPPVIPLAPPASQPTDPYGLTDPILQKIQAITEQARQNAVADALAARKQLAIAYGDTAGILDGSDFDQSTADAAHNNPFSVLAELNRGYDTRNHAIDENTNNENLFYSGEHVRQLSDSATQLQRDRASAASVLQNELGGIQSKLAAALTGADQQDIQGLEDAASRAQNRAITYGYNPGAGASRTPQSHVPKAPKSPLVLALNPNDARRQARINAYGG